MGKMKKISVLISHSSSYWDQCSEKRGVYAEHNSHMGEMLFLSGFNASAVQGVGSKSGCNELASGFSRCWCQGDRFCVCLRLFKSPTGMEAQCAQIEGHVWVGDEQGQEHAPDKLDFFRGREWFLKGRKSLTYLFFYAHSCLSKLVYFFTLYNFPH